MGRGLAARREHVFRDSGFVRSTLCVLALIGVEATLDFVDPRGCS
jgi:hypothetical protein